MPTVLLTSIGSRSAIGVVQSLSEIRASVRLVATNSNPKAAGNYLADRTILVPKTARTDDWRAALARLIEQERPAVVMAGRDEELPLLADLARDFAEELPGTVFLSPPRALVPAFNDKYETFLFAREHGLPFAESAVSEVEVRGLARRCGFPLVAKPRHGGHASRSVFLATDGAQLDACLETGGFVFQEPLGSETFARSLAQWSGHLGIPWKWSIDSLDHGIDMVLDRGTLVASCLSRGHAQGGMHLDLELCDEPAMRETLERYAKAFGALGHVGPLNLQGKLLPDGRYVPYELNARFVGTTIARTHLGRNLVVAALAHFGIVAPGKGTNKGADPVEQGRGNAVERNALFMPFARADMETLTATGDWSAGRRPTGS